MSTFRILVAITSANNIEYTENCIKSLKKCSHPCELDIMVFDDASTEDISGVCERNGIELYSNLQSQGLTSLWNAAYSYFEKHKEYTHLIITNNDVIFSNMSIEKMFHDMNDFNFVIVGPMSNKPGAYHFQKPNLENLDDISQIEQISNELDLIYKNQVLAIPVNKIGGFCFMLNREVEKIKNSVEYLIPPHLINVGNDDWLCDEIRQQFPNRVGLSLTSFIYHYKAITTRWLSGDREQIWRQGQYTTQINNKQSNSIRPRVLAVLDRAMGLGDGVMVLSTILDLSKKYDVRVLCTEQSYNIVKHIKSDKIEVFGMNDQGLFYNNDHIRAYNLIYWEVYNSLRSFPNHALNMIRKCGGLEPITKKDKYILPEIPIDPNIEKRVLSFYSSLVRPIIITHPFMSYWNKMIENWKHLEIVKNCSKFGTVIQIGGNVPPNMISPNGINMVGNTSLEQSFALIKYADLVVGYDSFIQHAAAHLKTPSVVMFCGTNPTDFGYPFNINICHPEIALCQSKCGRPMRWLYDYDYKDPKHWNTRSEAGWICPIKLCEKSITVEEVIEGVRTQLKIGKDRDWYFHDVCVKK